MDRDARVQRLLEQMLDDGRSPESVCRDEPELLPDVRAAWQRLAPLRAELSALFPAHGDGAGAGAGAGAAATTSAAGATVRIPGHELEGVLGRGGMGIVYRARHVRLGRTVALKVLLAGAAATPLEVARFRREAEVVASLRHANIVQVFEVGDCDGVAWFTMEFVGGGTLAARARANPFAPRDAAALVALLARAIDGAHRSGVVHRDLKPANVLLTVDGVPKISDFGLARRVDHATALTVGGALGTPSYMAPEQIARGGAEVGPAADVHALGAILYELLAGQPPFRGESTAAVLQQVLTVDPPPPSRVSSRVPRDLETIALECLRKEPARRYASAAELADDLERFLRHEPVRARRAGAWARALRWSRRQPAAAALVLLAIVGASWVGGTSLHERLLAAEQRAASAPWHAHVDGAVAALARSDVAAARGLLEQVPDALADELRARVAAARRDLLLVSRLDTVRSDRMAIVDGRFDLHANRLRAEAAYTAAFAGAELAVLAGDPAAVAAAVRASPIRRALVAALDDWALCTPDGARRAALLGLARACDPDPGGWRDRVRDPAVCDDVERLLALAAAAPMSEASVQLLVGLGERLQQAGAGAAFLREVQRAFPGDFWVNYTLGDALAAHEPQEALRYLQAAAAIRPHAAIAHLALARTLLQLERFAEAIACHRAALRADPRFALAHAELGMALLRQARLDEGIESLRESLRLDPAQGWVHNNLANALRDAGQFTAALASAATAARVAPDDPAPHYTVGHLLTLLGRHADALGSWQRAAALDPASDELRRLVGHAFAELGRFADAEAQFRAALARSPLAPAVLAGHRAVLVAQARDAAALADDRAALAAHPTAFAVWDGHAELCAFAGDHAGWRATCAELLARFADDADAHVAERIGRACVLAPAPELLEPAAALVDRALAAPAAQRAAWSEPYFRFARGLVQFRRGRFEDALATLGGDARTVLGPAPGLVRAMALQRLGDAGAAGDEFVRAVLRFDWRRTRASTREAWLYHVLRREAEALLLPTAAAPAGLGAPAPAGEASVWVANAAAMARASFAGDVVTAAREWERLLAFAPSVESVAGLAARRIAARLAAAASAVATTSDAERARCRARVLAHVRDVVAAFEDLAVDHDAAGRAQLALDLSTWRHDPELAAVAAPPSPATLPAAEAAAWQRVWHDADRVLAGLEAR